MQIAKRIIKRELKYDNVVVLKYYIEYPRIISESSSMSVKKFNLYNEQIAKSIQKNAEGDLYKEAIELYKYNKENNYPIMVYEIYRLYEITLNMSSMISLYADEYIFTGGAHGTTTRTSQTWNMINGRIVNLYELYSRNPYFILDILKEISNQIEQNKDLYFDDACCLAINNFNPQSFYLIPRGIVIYYQQYDIAPYSSGIRTFEIPKKIN